MQISDSPYIRKKAGWARAAVEAYPAGDPDDLATTIVDLIGDLGHLAEAEGFDADALYGSGMNHFHCEGGAGNEPDDIAEAEADYSRRNP